MYCAREIGVLWRCTLFGPYGAGIWPPPLWAPTPLSICLGATGTQFTRSLQEGWTWTVEWGFTASPTQILWSRIMNVILSLFQLENCLWSVYQMIVCLVLIAVIFLGWLTTRRNKRISYVHSQHFPGLCHEQEVLLIIHIQQPCVFQ
jgi:hypothetical protein